MISQRAIDLIVACEVSSRAYYEKKYQRPEWPGGASGITIGIGYDLGYADPAKITADWSDKVDVPTLKAMIACSGIHGENARTLLASVRNKIQIPWTPAMKVFMERDVPEWTRKVLDAISGAEKLSPDCLGAIVSLAYNRGASFNLQGDRYREMRAIRDAISSGDFDRVPQEIRSMKRLWPTVKGLRDRREAEAKLFEAGLVPVVHETETPVPLPPLVVNEKPNSVLPKPASVGSTVGGATVVGGGKAINTWVAPHYSTSTIVLAGIVVVIVAVALGFFIHSLQSSPTARQKG